MSILVNKTADEKAMNDIARRYLLPGGVFAYKLKSSENKEYANNRLEQGTYNS
jgi:hypothetical protein